MDNFSQQLKQFLSKLDNGQRFTILISGLAITFGMILLLFWVSKPKMQLLYTNMESKDMSGAVALFQEKNVKYSIGSDGASLFVPSESVHSMRMELAEKGIPSGGGVGFEIFDRTSFGISDFIQRTNYVRAIQGELSRTISKVNGVTDARVMIVMPENKLLSNQGIVRPTASVFVNTKGLVLREESVNAIRFLVSHAVEGMNINDVAVIDNKGKVLSQDLEENGAFGLASNQMRFRKKMEDYFSKKIETLLGKVVGMGNVVAKVSVDIETDATKLVEEKYDPEGQVIRQQTQTEDSSVSSEGNQTGAGAQPAVNPNATAAAQNANSARETRKNKTISYDTTKLTTETVKSPGKLKQIMASVFVAPKQSADANSTNASRTPEEISKLEAIVANAIGLDISLPENKNKITVQEMPFDQNNQAIAAVAMQSSSFAWIELAKNFIAVGIAIAMFLIFFRMIKRYKPSGSGLISGPEMIEDQMMSGGTMLPFMQNVTQKPTADLLNDLIQQKPENVSAVIKQWVRNPK